MSNQVQNVINQSMLNLSYDTIALNLKFERAFISVLENMLGPSTVTHYNRSSKLTLSGPAFSVVRQARGGGGLRGPDAKNRG